MALWLGYLLRFGFRGFGLIALPKALCNNAPWVLPHSPAPHLHPNIHAMPTSNDQDTLMASSSSVPTLSTPAASGSASKRDNLDIQDKYRKLKKRFFELEEVGGPFCSLSRTFRERALTRANKLETQGNVDGAPEIGRAEREDTPGARVRGILFLQTRR